MAREISTWRAFWITLIGGPVMLASLFAVLGPGAVRCVGELHDEHLLDAAHLTAQGGVVAHVPRRHHEFPQATVSYHAGGQAYVATLQGAGASPGNLPEAKALRVRAETSRRQSRAERKGLIQLALDMQGNIPASSLQCS